MSDTKNDMAGSGLSRRSMLGGVTAATAAAGMAMPAHAAKGGGKELVLVRKPALAEDGRIVAPCVRSRLFIRDKGELTYGDVVCDFVETPGASGKAFCSDLEEGEHAAITRETTLRGLVGMSNNGWELAIADKARAGVSPSSQTVSRLAISLPMSQRTVADRERYTIQIDPTQALKKLKSALGRTGSDIRVTVINDRTLFDDHDIDIPGVGRYFG